MNGSADTNASSVLGQVFPPTRWTLIVSASKNNSPEADAALGWLCKNYWQPLYVYVRRRGHGPEDAEDLVQEFFARVLKKEYFKEVTPEGGRFRNFLLVCIKRFLANEWDRAQCQKRGGGIQHVSLDGSEEEGGSLPEPSTELSPERAFDQQWAMTLLERTLGRLEDEYSKSGKKDTFARLSPLLGERQNPERAEVAQALGITPENLNVQLHRMRRRYQELLRMEISATVQTQEQVEQEIQDLFGAFS